MVFSIEHDVGGLDVAMQEAGFVHCLEPLEQPVEHPLDDRSWQLAAALEALLEGVTAQQPHDHVRRAIRFQEVVNTDDCRGAFEGRKNTSLLEKALATPYEILRNPGRARDDHRAVCANRQRRWQIF